MNSPFIRWLLDLQTIPHNAEGVRLVWERPFASWIWVLVVLGVIGVTLWAYGRLLGPKRGRVTLGVVRFCVLILVLVIISGPALELPRETIERDWIVMLLDRSASMTVPDAPRETAAPRRSRDEQLAAMLGEHSDLWDRLADKRQVLWLGFHDGAFNLAEPLVNASEADAIASPVHLEEPTGQQTRLDAAIEQALQRTAARALSGLVVFSDGRTTEPLTRASIRRLRNDQISVFTVPLGSADSPGDLAVRRVHAPRRAFVKDQVPVVVEIDRLTASGRALPAVVKLIDETSGDTLDEVELDGVDDTRTVTLTAEPLLAGEASWKVVVETLQPDLVEENNTKSTLIQLIDRPMRVLYIDGYPRWEYRYLKNLLVREDSIESSVMLISADRDFAQEGNQPITRLPRSPEEFAPYDVLVIGDVPGTFFSPEQLEMMRQHVALRGAGLLWIGGSRYTPRSYPGTPLADLLPIRGTLAIGPIGEPVNMQATELADRLGVLQLGEGDQGWPRQLSDPLTGWSRLAWAQRVEPGNLKPTAEVLAETVTTHGGAHLPLVVTMRFGAGQVTYVATDEIWRWRFGQGEMLPERFWVQIIRRLGREGLAGSDESARLEVNPRRLTTGQAVRISLQLLDASLVSQARPTVTARIETSEGSLITDIELQRIEVPGNGVGGEPAKYAATYLPGVRGELVVKVSDPSLREIDLQTHFDVYARDDELRRPETDHPLLDSLAAETGGTMLAPDELDDLEHLLPNRSVRTINPLTERIWDTPLAFILVLLLLAGEWVGRKVIRLA